MEFTKRFLSEKVMPLIENFGFKTGITFKISGKKSLNFNARTARERLQLENLP
jgi:hypothetical protein